MNKSLKIGIGLPAFNEEKNIAAILTKIQKFSYTAIVCNDGSSDLTGDIAEKMGAIVINHERNLGYGEAIRSLFKKSRELELDILVTFDADGQHQILDIKKILEPIELEQADIVIGSRFMEGAKNKVPKYRELGIKAINKITNTSINNKITDTQSGFRAYNKKAINEITPSETGMGVSTEILIKANKKNMKIFEVSIVILYEGDTSTHSPVSHGVSVVMSTMKFISIEHPLKFYGIPGIIFLTIGLFFIVWTIQEFSISRQIITNISLIGIGGIILGTILLMSSILLYSLINVVRER
jgi:glycosyltransferase involved in cell wall biosynthesis